MSRTLSDIERNTLRTVARTGYKTYRYGSTRPVTLPRVFKGEARKARVPTVLDIMRDWRLSPFEHEGNVRAGVRSGLCLGGHKGQKIGWHQADREAEALIGEALHLMGAKRPTLLEGQRQYSIEREYCQWCRGPLDDEDRTGHRRFCSAECSRSARNHNLPLFQTVSGIMRAAACYTVAKELQPQQECQWCKNLFKPASLLKKVKTVTCSVECNRAYVASLRGRQKCQHCDESFTPRWVNDKFCCVECQKTHRNQSRRAETAERHQPTRCERCGEQFIPKKAGTRFCGHRCRWKAVQERKQERNSDRQCPECRVVFKPVRPEAKCCSPRCALSFRARVAAKSQESAFICEAVEPTKQAA